MRCHDDRALELYLLFLAVASAAPWNVDESAKVWARALHLGATPGAVSGVSKIWKRLEDCHLVARARVKRRASIIALREDGTGGPYAHPGVSREPYFKLSFDYWTAEETWYRRLHLAEVAMLLIGLSLGGEFSLPYQRAKPWYGISADTAERGLRSLHDRGLLCVRTEFKEAPLSPEGYTELRLYTLQPPFCPGAQHSMSIPMAPA